MATVIPSFKKDNPFESINDNELIGITFNDQDGPAPDILWSSSKIKQLTLNSDNSQSKQLNAIPGNLAKFGDGDDLGQTIDSDISLNDNALPSANILWSSEKIANIPLPPFQLKQSKAIGGDIAVFGSDINTGQVMDSGLSVNDSSDPYVNVLWSSNKIQTNYQAKQSGAVFKNLASFGNGDGQVLDSGLSVNDDSLPAPNILYSSSKIQQLFPSQILFLPNAIPNSNGGDYTPRVGTLYVGIDGSSYIWNGSSYNGILVKAYSKFVARNPLSLSPGSNAVPLPLITSNNGVSSSGTISIDSNGIVSLVSSSQAPTLYKASFLGQGLHSNKSAKVSFFFFNHSINSQVGNSLSVHSLAIDGVFALSSQCLMVEYFTVPPLGQVVFSVRATTNSSDPVILGHNSTEDNPYLTVEQIY